MRKRIEDIEVKKITFDSCLKWKIHPLTSKVFLYCWDLDQWIQGRQHKGKSMNIFERLEKYVYNRYMNGKQKNIVFISINEPVFRKPITDRAIWHGYK